MKRFIEIDEIFKNQKNYFKTQNTKEVEFRIKQLDILKEAIEAFENNILEALRKDLNKSEFEAYETEIGVVLSEINHIRKHIKSWTKPKKVKSSLTVPGGKTYIYNQPYGVCLIMAPWNYPFQLCVSPLIGAIAAGNTCVVKPSELSPNTSKVIKEMISKYFDPKYIAVVEGEIEENKYLLEKDYDYIFFTGSPMVGKIVMASAAKRLIPCTLELGGKSPCIVDKNCDIELSAKRIAWGKLINAGQTCIAPDYIIAHKSIKKELIDKIILNIDKFYGESSLESNDYTSIINERHFNRILSLIDKDKVIYGGKSNINNLKIEPTIVDNVSLDDKVMEEEIFGPLIPILEFEAIDDIINIVEAHPDPLAMYLFTNDKKFENKIINTLSFGGGCINDTIMHITNPHAPFGGIRNSGIGSYHGEKSFTTFSHQKSVLKSSTAIDMKFKYPPYSKKSLELIKKAFKFM